LKKILFVIGQLGIGGAEHQLVYLASNLDKSKYEILVCSFSDDVSLGNLLDESGIPLVAIPKKMSPDLIRPFQLFKLVKSFKPDIIHSYLFVANTWARIAGKILGIPVIISERNAEPKKPLYMTFLNRLLYGMGDLLIANSQAGADQVVKTKEFPKKKINVVYNGLPIEKYKGNYDEKRKSEIKSSFGIPYDAKVIGVIGRLHFQKNHELLFESFQIVLGKLPNSVLLCIGDGPKREELLDLARSIRIDSKVIFVGERKDVRDCLSILDLMILPSRWEGLPNVILEAMAAKCPVIATKVGGVNEMIEDGQTGFLVESKNKEELAKKIAYVISHPTEVEQINQNAFEFVTANFSIEKMVSETEKIYEDLLIRNANNKT